MPPSCIISLHFDCLFLLNFFIFRFLVVGKKFHPLHRGGGRAVVTVLHVKAAP